MGKVQDWLRFQPIAHRGLHGPLAHKGENAQENSPQAFELAIKNNFAIELDVIVLSDGTCVVFHDEDLYRLTGVQGTVRSLHSEHLKNLMLSGTKGAPIPLFSDVLKLVNGRAPLLIEIKSKDQDTKYVAQKVWDTLKHYTGEYAVQSFNPFILLWFRKHVPKIVLGQLSYAYDDNESGLNRVQKVMLRHLGFAALFNPDFLAIHTGHLNAHAVKYYRKILKRPVLTWTVRSNVEWHEARPFADNLIFENFIPG